MMGMKIPGKLIISIDKINEMPIRISQAVVMTKEGVIEDFEINLHIRQGDGMSIILFILLMDAVIRGIIIKK